MAAKAKKEAKRLEKLKAEFEAWKRGKKVELQRELVFQERNYKKIDEKWRALMLKIKEPIFKKDIEIMWNVFERTLDKKDYLITYTMELMDVADDQFQRTVASFCDTIDNMIVKFLKDLEDMAKDNDRRTTELLKSSEEEFAKIMKDHDAAETHLQLLIFHSHTAADNLAWTTRGENLVKEDEEKTKYAEERENLRSFLENIYSNIWDEYKAVLKAYIVGTSENQKEVRKLRQKENMMADIIAAQGKRIANNDGLLKRLRSELAAYESGTKQAVFRDRRDRHRAACFTLKQTLTNGCSSDAQQLSVLVRSADDAIECLEAAAKKTEKILKLAGLCRKFETQQEKVLPFGTTGPDVPVMENLHPRNKQQDNNLVMNALLSTSGLYRLWQRIAHAELSRRALLREKEMLLEENESISEAVEQHTVNNTSPDSTKCICTKPLSNEALKK